MKSVQDAVKETVKEKLKIFNFIENTKIILHICNKNTWEESLKNLKYEGDTLKTEGFIHCSTKEQVIEVANYIFKGKEDLILLAIDESKVTPEIKYEDAGNGKFYPHIYGPLNTDAVIKTFEFNSNKDGNFELPKGL
jgi:uncharacterized protein (DUF952 family)